MKSTIFVILTCFLLVLSGCASTEDDTVLKIGAPISLSSYAAAFGEDTRRGIDLAVSEINAQGGVNGKLIEVIYEDDATDPKQTVSAFQKLAQVDNVDAMIGGTWDFTYNAIAPLAQEQEMILITPQNMQTAGLVMNDYTFVMQPPMVDIVGTLEAYLKENDITSIAVVRFSSPFGEAISEGLQQIMDRNDGAIVIEEVYTDLGTNDFSTTITKIKQENPQAVFVDIIGADVLTFAKQAKELDLNALIVGPSGIGDVAKQQEDLASLSGILYFDWGDSSSEKFIEKYTQTYERAPSRSADRAYDAVYLLAEALQQENPIAYIQSTTFSTVNGDFYFKDNVIDSKTIFLYEITSDDINELSRTKVIR